MRQADNELLTRVGLGTPAGELLRRYWHPVSIAGELTEEKPIKAVKLLGEKLVVFRLPLGPGESQPRYGLVAEQCRHRLASLAYGRVDHEGIRCPYHGWKYDLRGRCLETPPEPSDSKYYREIRQPAYPVQKLAGLLFAYLGPEPAPLLPRWDVLAREDGTHHIQVQPLIDCNWLQAQENSLDPTHVYYLHGHQLVKQGVRKTNNYRPITGYDFEQFERGIRKRRTFGGDGLNHYEEPGHPAVFPNILRHDSEGRDGMNPYDGTMAIDMHLRVPIDDTHTQVFWIGFTPSPDGSWTDPYEEDPTVEFVATLKNERGDFDVRTFPAQDSMAWVTQGPIFDRTVEHLGASD